MRNDKSNKTNFMDVFNLRDRIKNIYSILFNLLIIFFLTFNISIIPVKSFPYDSVVIGNNKFYTDRNYNIFVQGDVSQSGSLYLIGQGTWYVYGRIQDKGLIDHNTLVKNSMFQGNAQKWIYQAGNLKVDNIPQANSIIVWQQGIDNKGAIGFVESIDTGRPLVTMSNIVRNNEIPSNVYQVISTSYIGVILYETANVSSRKIASYPALTIFNIVARLGNSWYKLQAQDGNVGFANLLAHPSDPTVHNFTGIALDPIEVPYNIANAQFIHFGEEGSFAIINHKLSNQRLTLKGKWPGKTGIQAVGLEDPVSMVSKQISIYIGSDGSFDYDAGNIVVSGLYKFKFLGIGNNPYTYYATVNLQENDPNYELIPLEGIPPLTQQGKDDQTYDFFSFYTNAGSTIPVMPGPIQESFVNNALKASWNYYQKNSNVINGVLRFAAAGAVCYVSAGSACVPALSWATGNTIEDVLGGYIKEKMINIINNSKLSRSDKDLIINAINVGEVVYSIYDFIKDPIDLKNLSNIDKLKKVIDSAISTAGVVSNLYDIIVDKDQSKILSTLNPYSVRPKNNLQGWKIRLVAKDGTKALFVGMLCPITDQPTNNIQGQIIDCKSKQFISDVTVVCGNNSVLTDSTGHFTITGIASSNVTISFTKQGYNKKTQDLNLNTSQNHNIDIGIICLDSINLPTLRIVRPNNSQFCTNITYQFKAETFDQNGNSTPVQAAWSLDPQDTGTIDVDGNVIFTKAQPVVKIIATYNSTIASETISVTDCSSSVLRVSYEGDVLCVGDETDKFSVNTSITNEEIKTIEWWTDNNCLTFKDRYKLLAKANCPADSIKVFAKVTTKSNKVIDAIPAAVKIVTGPTITLATQDNGREIKVCAGSMLQIPIFVNVNPPGTHVNWQIDPKYGAVDNGIFKPNPTMSIGTKGIIEATAGSGNCQTKASIDFVVTGPCQYLVIEPDITIITDCKPINFKAYIMPERKLCDSATWQITCLPSNAGSINSSTGVFTPFYNASGTCAIRVSCGTDLVKEFNLTVNCKGSCEDCQNVWILAPKPITDQTLPILPDGSICAFIPYQFRSYCNTQAGGGQKEMTEKGIWRVDPESSAINIDNKGVLTASTIGDYKVLFDCGNLHAEYSIKITNNYCNPQPIYLYFNCFVITQTLNIPFELYPILQDALGQTVAPTKPYDWKTENDQVVQKLGERFVGVKIGRTIVDCFYGRLHTRLVIIINPPSSSYCSNGAIIAPSSASVAPPTNLKPIPVHYYCKCSTIKFQSIFRDSSGNNIDCSSSIWDVVAMDPSNQGTFTIQNGVFTANKSGWYGIIVTCCDLTVVLCVYVLDINCTAPPPQCQWNGRKTIIVLVAQFERIDARLLDVNGKPCPVNYSYKVEGNNCITQPDSNGDFKGLYVGKTFVTVSNNLDQSFYQVEIEVTDCTIKASETKIDFDLINTCTPVLKSPASQTSVISPYEEQTVTITKENDDETLIWSNARWLQTCPVKFTNRRQDVRIIVYPEFLPKGPGCAGVLTVKSRNCKELQIDVNVYTNESNTIIFKAFQCKQVPVKKNNKIVAYQAISDAEILKQLIKAGSQYSIATSCNGSESTDLLKDHGIIPFQVYIPKIPGIPPGNTGNRTFLPLRYLVEKLGLNLEWNNGVTTIWGYGRIVIIDNNSNKIQTRFYNLPNLQRPAYGSNDICNPIMPRNGVTVVYNSKLISTNKMIGLAKLIRGLDGNDHLVGAARIITEAFFINYSKGNEKEIVEQDPNDKTVISIIYRPGWVDTNYGCTAINIPSKMFGVLIDVCTVRGKESIG